MIVITESNNQFRNYGFNFFDQLKQVLQVFFADLLLGFFVRNNLIGSKIRGNSGFVVLELVDEFGKKKLTKM